MKRIMLVIFSLVLVYSSLFASMTAIREDGKIILLNSDKTWTLKSPNKTTVTEETIPSETVLYNYALKEELYEHYLNYYEGTDLMHTISILDNLADKIQFDYKKATEYKECLIKGIQYTYQYGKIFILPYCFDGIVSYNLNKSNLAFFWEYAKILEEEGQYEEALSFYSQLKDLFIKTGEKYQFKTMQESSLDEIEGKIYKMQYLASTK